jgi:DNA (cytosine-5)-methyltransferase 1
VSKPTVISLFTGAGGLDYGFEAAGFRTTVALEMDPKCCQTLRSNRNWPVIQADVTSVKTQELLQKAKLRPGEADVLIGGPPCQPFSKSGFWATGEAKRLSDPRASTIEAYMRILAEARPAAFLLENVEGLGFRGKDEGLLLIQRRLEAINRVHKTHYRATIATLNSADYGVPQLRRRMFVVGSREGKEFEFPAPTHGNPLQSTPLQPWMTAWDALHDLREDSDVLALRGKWAGLLPSIPEGQNYLWHTERGEGEPLFGWRRRYWSFLLKLAKDQPAWTIQAQPGPATGPFHWSNRRLSAREMARLQTFPDDVEIGGGIADAQRQLGNAVPALLAEVIAREIRAQFFGSYVRSRPRLALQAASRRVPKPERVLAVPAVYLNLKGAHEAHPGTGKGFRAARRGMEGARSP